MCMFLCYFVIIVLLQRIYSKEKGEKLYSWFRDTNVDICFTGETHNVVTVFSIKVQGQAYSTLSSAET